MGSKLAHTLFTLASVGVLASAQLAVDTTPVTAAASVETVSMIDASGLPITTVSDAGDNAWYIPLTGPASAATAAWGANVHMHSDAAALLPITFGTAPAPTSTPTVHTTRTLSQETSALPTATVSPIGTPSGDESTTSTLEIPLNPEANALLLGADTALTIFSTVIATAENPTNISTTNLTTLPVGMNLGFGSHWPGALVFGGNYDANRIWNESHWQTTPETSAGNGSFAQTGTQLLASGVQLKLYPTPNLTGDTNTTYYPFDTSSNPTTTSTTLPATLNFTAETLTVPDASFCDRNFTVVFNPASATYPLFGIPIWADLVPAGSRCVVGSGGDEIILGRPFFQAAYVYVTDVGDLYFSSIRRDGSVGVAPREFDLHAVLGTGGGGGDVYANATAEEAGAKASAVSGAGRVAPIMSSSAWGGVVLVVGVVVVGWAV
ncbi:hypothetical protein ASPACDRAFT_47027 [Aspergillus aculeatus ATCC 16872]|uniref:Peptidase A1 domain-containing protein n=1 Tax=Aspergillus aculeatus (strain ATCC 16872 / CBS 172.66 / WB 5094) TaxID=690307 RepID=A0A1L9WJD2_ASPA1|nr:uncharacterized protein ASPACDRAFT_47027 [Aspergillus aculeatus ATCC 16872]OJJ96257.1 hypothetical protein ASPACDRAFT_47027 [Aspergillus aculeatus ATCC 16872]